MPNIPDRVTTDGLEEAWTSVWQRDQTYAFDRTQDRERVYSIDTPPPTVSGELHLGTAFGYIQVDAMARYRRMSGREVFYPIGWDDNGLPTERRVEKVFGVKCDPSLPYDPDLTIDPDEARDPKAKPVDVSRRNFLEFCEQQTAHDEVQFEAVLRRIGLSVDWSLQYATIDPERRRVAQQAFLDDLGRGSAYLADAPTLWDVDFQTAVAQAEIEDRQAPGVYVRYEFATPDGSGLEIETSRPELLAACVAVVVHPDDERYASLVGTTVTSPLFGVEVPVHAHPLAAPDKGTGAAMVCTFGDTTDVVWWRELGLPLRAIMGRDGRLVTATPEWLSGDAATSAWAEIAGKKAVAARTRTIELLSAAGALTAEPKPTQHAVKFYEKGDRPLEVVTSRQWYIRNGARDADIKAKMLQGATDLAWFPDHMRTRLEHWINGLNSDWLISRQRYFGVPFPVWYSLDADGNPDWSTPLLPTADQLPVDPQADVPTGYTADQRGVPGGFLGDPDVMDTWATSSLTPQIVCGWGRDDDLFARTYPMDLRPQGPEIIRTWTFATMLRSLLAFDTLPWKGVSVNGWILDPDRKKMSKSKGNTEGPADFVDEFGADGLRYWSCHAAQGVDTAVDKGQMKVGRRLAIKLLNVSKFVLGMLPEGEVPTGVTEPVDRAMIAQLHQVSLRAEAAFERNDYRGALVEVENFFWHYCDDYVELVKSRAYGDAENAASAQAALAQGLSILQRLLAPFLPFVTEEAWSWTHTDSVHRQPWPGSRADAAGVELQPVAAEGDVFEFATEVLRQVRRAKTEKQVGMRTPVTSLTVTTTAAKLDLLRAAAPDITAAGSVEKIAEVEAPDDAALVVDVVLGDPPPKAPKNPA
ncbi:valine--tRNA ligase [Jatrophihabitans sp. YIM 134969]